jgi:hypothetical protein
MNSELIDKLKQDLPDCFPPAAGKPSFDDLHVWPAEDLENDSELFSDDSDISDGELIETSNRIKDIFGDNDPFPGSPTVDEEGKPTIETLAFYLPYHKFEDSVWGVYLIAEGVIWLRNKFYSLSRSHGGSLNLIEAQSLAKSFLFYHERFHNCVESFATKMEISNRSPFYISGVTTLYKTPYTSPNPRIYHEETFANKYAIEKSSDYFANKFKPTHRYPNPKQNVKEIVKEFIKQYNSGHYKEALQLTESLRSQALIDKQNKFLEEICQNSFHSSSHGISPSLWSAFAQRLSGSIPRGSRFSYVTPKGSLVATRAKLGGRLLRVNSLDKFIEKKFGVTKIKSKVHKKTWVRKINGITQKSDMPHGSEIDKHTIKKIINDLDLKDDDNKLYNYVTLRDDIKRY